MPPAATAIRLLTGKAQARARRAERPSLRREGQQHRHGGEDRRRELSRTRPSRGKAKSRWRTRAAAAVIHDAPARSAKKAGGEPREGRCRRRGGLGENSARSQRSRGRPENTAHSVITARRPLRPKYCQPRRRDSSNGSARGRTALGTWNSRSEGRALATTVSSPSGTSNRRTGAVRSLTDVAGRRTLRKTRAFFCASAPASQLRAQQLEACGRRRPARLRRAGFPLRGAKTASNEP